MSPLRVLIAGGGVAGVEAALALRHFAGDRVHLIVTAPGPDLVRRQESVTTPFTGVGAPRLPLERLAALGVDLRQDAVAAVDADRHEAPTTDAATLRYDRLVIAVGARGVDALPGALHFRGPLSAGRLEGVISAARRIEAPLTLVVPPPARGASCVRGPSRRHMAPPPLRARAAGGGLHRRAARHTRAATARHLRR